MKKNFVFLNGPFLNYDKDKLHFEDFSSDRFNIFYVTDLEDTKEYGHFYHVESFTTDGKISLHYINIGKQYPEMVGREARQRGKYKPKEYL